MDQLHLIQAALQVVALQLSQDPSIWLMPRWR